MEEPKLPEISNQDRKSFMTIAATDFVDRQISSTANIHEQELSETSQITLKQQDLSKAAS